MTDAREMLSHPHPFATKTVFKTDGRKIVAEIAHRHGLMLVYDLKSKNYEMPFLFVIRSLARSRPE